MKNIINTALAPAPIGPYSQAVIAGNLLFVSGQIAINPQSGILVNENIEIETQQVMENIAAVLEKAGAAWENIVKTTIFLKDMNNFPKVNNVYGSVFKSDYPARETVEVSRLPKDANVEISVIAAL
jgi:2-iminobutanoate/2-iminopropanoate deaminase